MKVYKQTETKYYKYQYEDFVQPILTSNGTMGGDSFAVNQSTQYTSENSAFNCFNGDTTTIIGTNRWQVNGTNLNTEYYIYWYNPIPLKISNLKIWNSETNYTVKDYVLYGSDDYSIWETITSGTNTVKGELESWNIAVSTDNMYKYFRLGCKPNSTTSLQITEIQITAQIETTIESTQDDYDYSIDVENYCVPKIGIKYYGIGG